MIDKDIVLHTLKCAPSQYPQVLEEQFPHILENILKLWDSPEAEPYIADLLRPNVGRFDRDGFPDQAWKEILHLQVLHGKQYHH